MSNQREYLLQVPGSVVLMPKERRARIAEASEKIMEVLVEFGEDGQMALALPGLEGAAKAEQEEETANGIQ